jgi:hypothetical protein
MARQGHDWERALEAYGSLATMGDTDVEGAPAELQARRARCDLAATLGRHDAVRQEVQTLERDLLAGRWRLDRPAWELTERDAERWSGRPVAYDAVRRQASLAAEHLWQEHLEGAAPPAREAREHPPL